MQQMKNDAELITQRLATTEDTISDLLIEMEELETQKEAIRIKEETQKELIEKLREVARLYREQLNAYRRGNSPVAVQVESGTFKGLTLIDAVRKYLKIVGGGQSHQQVLDALLRGGYETKSKQFETTLRNLLYRYVERGAIIYNDKRWFLPEWGIGSPEAPTVEKSSNARSSTEKSATIKLKAKA